MTLNGEQNSIGGLSNGTAAAMHEYHKNIGDK